MRARTPPPPTGSVPAGPIERSGHASPRAAAAVPVDEIRDYHRVNAELGRLLDLGHSLIRLERVAGQRLLLAGLVGPWEAAIEVHGPAGPELAAGMNAPGLVVVAHGDAADGAGRGLVAGMLWVRGVAGNLVGYEQRGGSVVVEGPARDRAGLRLSGGLLLLLSGAGRLAGERQAGGTIVVRGPLGADPAHARRGGVIVLPGATIDPETAGLIGEALGPCRDWVKLDV